VKYELTWGDSRGNSTRLDLPGALEVEMVAEIAQAVKRWYDKRSAGIKAERFVTVFKVEEQTVVTPVEFE